jgi:hypothetical protein
MSGAHLVGSVNLGSNREVFESVSRAIPSGLQRLPDGETDRPFVTWMMPRIIQNPGVELKEGGAMGGLLPKLSVRPSDDPLEFDNLGFADAAVASYAVFSELKSAGTIAPEVRFQVSIPSAATLSVALADVSEQEVLHEALLQALVREIESLVKRIPHRELAIQFDLPAEIGVLEGVFPAWTGPTPTPLAEQAARLASTVPDDVEIGFHLCYGDPPPSEGERGQHWADPKDAGVLVGLANALSAAVSRPIQWIHIPVPIKRDDEDYFRPLGDLKLKPQTKMFLGLVHDLDGPEGAQRRMRAAQPFLSEFGVGTECGMGRVPTSEIPGLLELHGELAAVEQPA